MQCTGAEQSIYDCPHTHIETNECTDLAGVTCEPNGTAHRNTLVLGLVQIIGIFMQTLAHIRICKLYEV